MNERRKLAVKRHFLFGRTEALSASLRSDHDSGTEARQRQRICCPVHFSPQDLLFSCAAGTPRRRDAPSIPKSAGRRRPYFPALVIWLSWSSSSLPPTKGRKTNRSSSMPAC